VVVGTQADADFLIFHGSGWLTVVVDG
jgi:hypothetical protein